MLGIPPGRDIRNEASSVTSFTPGWSHSNTEMAVKKSSLYLAQGDTPDHNKTHPCFGGRVIQKRGKRSNGVRGDRLKQYWQGVVGGINNRGRVNVAWPGH